MHSAKKKAFGLSCPFAFFFCPSAFLPYEQLINKKKHLSKVRGKIASMVFQDSMTSFDPLFSIGYQIVETFLTHKNINSTRYDKKHSNKNSYTRYFIKEKPTT
jgi:ABC-type microcin C transport system duplicated ATPase subunit YejF